MQTSRSWNFPLDLKQHSFEAWGRKARDTKLSRVVTHREGQPGTVTGARSFSGHFKRRGTRLKTCLPCQLPSPILHHLVLPPSHHSSWEELKSEKIPTKQRLCGKQNLLVSHYPTVKEAWVVLVYPDLSSDQLGMAGRERLWKGIWMIWCLLHKPLGFNLIWWALPDWEKQHPCIWTFPSSFFDSMEILYS